MQTWQRDAFRGAMGVCSVALLCAAAACEAPHRPVNGVVVIEVPIRDNVSGVQAPEAQAVEMQTANKLVVTLAAHGGTGYAWEMAGPAPAILHLDGLPETADARTNRSESATSGTAVGGPLWTTFRFHAVSQGDGVVRFVLRRPWEPTGVRADQLDVKVTVKPQN